MNCKEKYYRPKILYRATYLRLCAAYIWCVMAFFDDRICYCLRSEDKNANVSSKIEKTQHLFKIKIYLLIAF